MAATCASSLEYSRNTDSNYGNVLWPTKEDGFQLSKFDELLREKWKLAMANGCFRYNLDDVQTKVIPGKYKYVAQLNVRRASDRRPPALFQSVKESFDYQKFHFLKIPTKEVLFELIPKDGLPDSEHYGETKHQIIINVSPIEMGHVLLVPFIDKCLPQILTVGSLALAFDIVLLSNHRGFRVGWNSMGAFASVNHLHFHALYLDYEIFADHMEVSHICNGIYETTDAKTCGFAFQLDDFNSTDEMARLISQIATYLSDHEIAHNLLIMRGPNFGNPKKITLRAFLAPGKTHYGPCNDPFNCAALEKGGHLPVKEQEAYTSMTEDMANRILEKFSLTTKEFIELKLNLTKWVSNS